MLKISGLLVLTFALPFDDALANATGQFWGYNPV